MPHNKLHANDSFKFEFKAELPPEESVALPTKSQPRTTRPIWLKIYSVVAYVLLIMLVLLVALNYAAEQNMQTAFGFGFSYAEDVPNISDKSLLINERTEPQDYKQGDMIFIALPNGEYKTAQIDGIITNYEQTGKLGFRIEDESELLSSEAVIGKITHTWTAFGRFIAWIGRWLWLLFAMFALLITSEVMLKHKLYKKDEALPDEQNEEQPLLGKKSKRKVARVISNITTGVAIVTVLIGVLAYASSGSVKNLFGFSCFTVLTPSMQSVLPVGSFIVVKQTPAENIHVDDDITYLQPNGTTVTHRVIEVYQNYEETNANGFQTKGIENAIPDPEIVLAKNVVGVVKFHIPHLGAILLFIAENVWFVVVWFGLFSTLSVVIRIYVEESKKKKRHSPKTLDQPCG